jgi:hypothetical protein
MKHDYIIFDDIVNFEFIYEENITSVIKKIKDKLFYNKTSINENLNNQFPQFNSYLDLNDTKKNQCLIKKQSSLDDIFSN